MGSPAFQLEPLRHRALEDAEELLALEEQARQATRHEDDRYRRLWRAVMLAPTLEVCDALLRGERVPLSRLDPMWVRRFGIR